VKIRIIMLGKGKAALAVDDLIIWVELAGGVSSSDSYSFLALRKIVQILRDASD